MKKQTKYKIKPVPVAILCGTILLIIAGVVAIVSGFGKNQEQKPTIDVKPVGSRPQPSQGNETQSGQVKVSVKIGMEDCILTTDQSIKVTVTVEPSDTDAAVIWKSSDESVMTVTSDGIISAKKTGVSALTATVGNVTDAIVVKWVSPQESSSSSVPVNPPAGETGTVKPILPLQPEKPTQGQSGENTTGSTQNPTQGSTQVSTPAPTQGSTQVSTQAPTQGSTQAPTQGTTQGSTQTPTTGREGLKSTDLYTVLPGCGFTRYISNVYVYGTEKENYCGEVIIESNVATIYIGTRTAEFDNAVQTVLTYLLPDNAGDVWKTYLGAGSDTTFMVGTRKVRIVTPKNGGHSQIVVWN